MQSSDTLLEEALKLPEEERARVALRLSESLSGLPDAHAHEAWAGEIARRIARLNYGTARTVTAAEALSWARARLAARRVLRSCCVVAVEEDVRVNEDQGGHRDSRG